MLKISNKEIEMSSSIFEVKETDSDGEKVLGFGLDTCEENGIMSTQSDSELPKDHTYTKEPDVLQDEDVNENDDSNNQVEDSMNNNEAPAKKTRASRATKVEKPAKVVRRGKSKRKIPAKKETTPPKKAQMKKDDVIADIAAVTEDLVKQEKADVKAEEDAAAVETEVESKPAKRSRKRKIEEKENVLDQDSTEEPAANSTEPSQKKNVSATKQKKTKVVKATKQKFVLNDDMIDNHNLPKGWLRKTVVRKTGKSAGQIDVYIYSPDGFKLRSRPDVAAYLQRTKSNLKVEDFNFSKKAILENPLIKPISAEIPKRKPAPAKSKTPAKKKEVGSPKKTSKTLLVKFVSESRSKRPNKKNPRKAAKANKTVAKGKETLKAVVKGSKKKKTA
ncbi:MBD domain-containing protein [Nephila pilipes]|uniref:MBD domain-containing protein n=1 Tax=Nephila pilipes TaxID=299642 RepID=A0A8X6MHD5_NEPPI|nr:MBD domain-containing protein [Nephila pilipes]